MGVSGATLEYLTQDALAEVTHDPTEEVPYVARYKNVSREPGELPEREPIYKTIEREEWERRRTAINVRERVASRIEKLDYSDQVDVVYTGMEESPTDFGVVVTYPEGSSFGVGPDGLENMLPDKLTGVAGQGDYRATREDIPIKIAQTKKGSKTGAPSCLDWKVLDEVPGGTPVNMKSDGSLGTLCAIYFDPDPNTSNMISYVTSGHVADTVGDIGEQGGAGPDAEVGKVQKTVQDPPGDNQPPIDYAILSRREAVTPYIADPNDLSKDLEILGIVANEELEYLVDTDSTLYTQGSTTCRSAGTAAAMYAGGEEVRINLDGLGYHVDDGDSGGPIFQKVSGGAFIAGVISGWRYDFPELLSVGTTAETVETHNGGAFLSNS